MVLARYCDIIAVGEGACGFCKSIGIILLFFVSWFSHKETTFLFFGSM